MIVACIRRVRRDVGVRCLRGKRTRSSRHERGKRELKARGRKPGIERRGSQPTERNTLLDRRSATAHTAVCGVAVLTQGAGDEVRHIKGKRRSGRLVVAACMQDQFCCHRGNQGDGERQRYVHEGIVDVGDDQRPVTRFERSEIALDAVHRGVKKTTKTRWIRRGGELDDELVRSEIFGDYRGAQSVFSKAAVCKSIEKRRCCCCEGDRVELVWRRRRNLSWGRGFAGMPLHGRCCRGS